MNEHQQATSGPLRTRTGRVRKAKKGLRVHACETCGKVYTRNEHLRRHQQMHGVQAGPDAVLSGEQSQGMLSPMDDAIFDIEPNLLQESSATSLFDASNAINLDDFIGFADENALESSDLAALLDGTSADSLSGVFQDYPLPSRDIEALGRSFRETLYNDFHYSRFVGSVGATQNMKAKPGLETKWKKMLKLYSQQRDVKCRRMRSQVYQSSFSLPTHSQASVIQRAFWTQMHPHLGIFKDHDSFQQAMALQYLPLWLSVMALGVSLSEAPQDRLRAETFAEDALDSLILDAPFDSEPLPVDHQRAAVLLQVYATFFARRPHLHFPSCFNQPATDTRVKHLQQRLRRLRAALYLPPTPTTAPDPDTPFLRLVTALSTALPLRPLLIVAGQSFLNGTKVSAAAYGAAQRSLRHWTRVGDMANVRRLSRDVLEHESRTEMEGCPWRDRAGFVACLAAWAVGYASGEVDMALVEAQRLLSSTRGGWIGEDMHDTLDGLVARGGEKGWF